MNTITLPQRQLPTNREHILLIRASTLPKGHIGNIKALLLPVPKRDLVEFIDRVRFGRDVDLGDCGAEGIEESIARAEGVGCHDCGGGGRATVV